MNKRHLSGYLVVAILSIFFSLPVLGQKVLGSIVKNGEMRIGTTGTQPPYSMKSKTGELVG